MDKTEEQNEQPRKGTREYSGDEEVIERNMERSRELIEARKHNEDEGKASPPGPGDPQSRNEGAYPGQWDMPIGGQSGPNVQGGSTRRHKPN